MSTLSLSDFDYTLPDDRIAQSPMEPRDASKLLVINRQNGSFQDQIFRDLETLLTSQDVLVLNNTRVIPARIYGKKSTGGAVEILLEKETATTASSITWEVLTKPGLKKGEPIFFDDKGVRAICIEDLGYSRKVEFSLHREQFFVWLTQFGHTPLPPYIKWDTSDEQTYRKRYQTVYAQFDGAVAAPTAGLHFTPQLLARLQENGVQIEYVTLHVGLGTFLPVKIDDVTKHQMHAERYEITSETAERLNRAKQQGKRIIAVGTTTVRVLETASNASKLIAASSGETSIYIYPPYQYKFVDSLITNFHIPKSTLLMLVSALVSAPNRIESQVLSPFHTFEDSLVGRAYHYALKQNYRFYSFGDAMWIQ